MKMKIKKAKKEINDLNRLEVTVEHTDFQGGDAGHGCYVKIQIEDLASTYMEVNGQEEVFFELLLRGDAEKRTIIEAFEFILSELKK